MSDLDLQSAISDFERVLKACDILCRTGNSVARALCDLFASKSARLVQMCVAAQMEMDPAVIGGDAQAGNQYLAQKRPPNYEIVKSAARKLFAAVSTGDRAGTLSALKEMGVADLCPTPEHLFPGLEATVRSIIGRAQLIPLIELSIFAIEVGDCNRANKYATEARGSSPGASELHDLCAVEGVIGLIEGDIAKAISYLMESIHVCMEDEIGCLACSVRAPNMILAEKLLELGFRDEVIEYLIQCQDVWEHHKNHFATWIDAIRAGGRPEFLISGLLGAMSRPSVRMRHLYATACLLEEEPRLRPLQSKAEVMAGRERLRAEYRRLMSAAIKGELGTTKN